MIKLIFLLLLQIFRIVKKLSMKNPWKIKFTTSLKSCLRISNSKCHSNTYGGVIHIDTDI